MSSPRRLMFVFGTRPEAIKMAPVILEAQKRKNFSVQVAVTAQHRQMLDQVLEVFDLKPDVDLNLMVEGQSLNSLSSRALEALPKVFSELRPDLVLVHGDTTTTMITSLAAFHSEIPVAHVEAGLRTHNLKAPFPEEMNRRLVGILGQYHFAPTERAAENLRREGCDSHSVCVAGNTVVDALHWVQEKMKRSPEALQKIDERFYGLAQGKKIVLVTIHRRENFKEGLASVCRALVEICRQNSNVHFIVPLHLNPVVQKTAREILSQESQVSLIEPLSYLPFLRLMQICDFILTDSGGLQEEAPSFQKPLLILRETTERPEAVDSGCAELVGLNTKKIVDSSLRLLTEPAVYSNFQKNQNPFGDGKASQRILDFLTEKL